MTFSPESIYLSAHQNKSIMKKMILLFFLMGSLSAAKAQIMVNGVDINKEDAQYVEMMASCKDLFCKKILVNIDYGQKVKLGDSQTIIGRMVK